MAEPLSIFEKYPDSWRTDHPNYGDVSKTTYAKGIITDFEKISDDPLQVSSRVKVEVNGQASDYIPLLFHPKAKYWDDATHQAQDFNEAEQYFERAWMSFRCGDEVAVMLKEGVPVAVKAFADGVPRIGENWVKGEAPSLPNSYNGLVGDYVVDEAEKGPDGLDLGLKQIAEYADGSSANESFQATYTARQTPYTDGIFYYTAPYSNIYKIRVFVLSVGPILFAPYLILRAPSGGGGSDYYIIDFIDDAYIMWWQRGQPGYQYFVDGSEGMGQLPGWEFEPPPNGFRLWVEGGAVGAPAEPGNEWACQEYTTKSGLYSKELYARVLSSFPSIDLSGGSAHFGSGFPSGLRDSPLDLAGPVSLDSYDPWKIEGVKFTTRPHTKTELQAAGMWPGAS